MTTETPVLSVTDVNEAFNFSKNPLRFSNNYLVSSDIYSLIKYINSCDFFNVGTIMTSIENNSKTFYNPDMKKELLSLLKSFLTIRRYIQTRYINKGTPQRVNELSLSLTSIKPDKIIELCISDSIYIFDINELLKIYKFSLNNIDNNLYFNGSLVPPRNPYTNIGFTLKENIIIYNKFKEYYISIARSLPIYLEKFKSVYFDMELYLRHNFPALMSKSVSAYIKNLSKEQFNSEFQIMINSSVASKNSYCKYCYKKYDLRKLFSKTLELYILNSNNIFTFGDSMREYYEVIIRNNLNFNKNHKKIHRKRMRKYNIRRLNAITNSTPTPLLEDHFLSV